MKKLPGARKRVCESVKKNQYLGACWSCVVVDKEDQTRGSGATHRHTIRITTLAIDIGSVQRERGFTARLRLKIDYREATSGARYREARTAFEPVD